jgi:hypothetical protein
MLLPNKLDQNVKWGQFHLGYHLGMAAVLAFWMLWDCGVEVMREHKVTLFLIGLHHQAKLTMAIIYSVGR